MIDPKDLVARLADELQERVFEFRDNPNDHNVCTGCYVKWRTGFSEQHDHEPDCYLMALLKEARDFAEPSVSMGTRVPHTICHECPSDAIKVDSDGVMRDVHNQVDTSYFASSPLGSGVFKDSMFSEAAKKKAWEDALALITAQIGPEETTKLLEAAARNVEYYGKNPPTEPNFDLMIDDPEPETWETWAAKELGLNARERGCASPEEMRSSLTRVLNDLNPDTVWLRWAMGLVEGDGPVDAEGMMERLKPYLGDPAEHYLHSPTIKEAAEMAAADLRLEISRRMKGK